MSIIINDGVKISKTNTPTREGERIASLSQMGTIPTPSVGMRVFVEDSGKEYVITSLKEKEVAGEVIPNAVIDTYVELAYQKSVDELQSTLEGVEANLAGAIEAESTRAKAAEGSLQNKIQQEKSEILNSLEAVEESLANNIATEEERATEAEQMLRESLQAHSAANIDTFAAVQSRHDEFVLETNRKNSELATAITTEEQRATEAEQMLRESLQAHSAANIDAFAAVQSRHDEFVLETNRKNSELATAITTEVAKEQQRAKSVEEELRTTKADEVGYHKKMTVGFADNLVGRGEATNNMFTFRATGDIASVEDGSARLEKIKGNTIVWNQFAQIKSGLSNNMVLFTNNGDGSYNVVTDIDAKSAANTYFEIANVANCEGEKLLIFGAPATATSASYCLKTDDGHTIGGNGAIVTSTMAYNRVYIFVAKEVAINSIVVFKPQVFNLTRMFGPGNEPATIAEFRKLFPEEYYSYNDGEMQSFIAEAIETTGFNQWDEEWALGVITNGADKASNRNILSKNYIPIIQGYDYYLKAPYDIYLACYDGEKNFIGNYTKNDTDGLAHANTVIESSYLQSGTLFVRFHVAATYGVVYKNDICINISHSGYRNGEYEPYQEYRRDLSSILDIKDSDGNALFPDGLKSAGGVHDEITPTQAIKRVGVIEDLSLLNWSRIITNTSNKYRFIAENVLSDGVTGSPSNQYKIMNAVCSFIKTIGGGYTYTCDSGIAPYNSSLYLYIESYATNTVAELKSALSGHKLYYELKEPIVVDLENPINLDYSVWDFGTEKIVSSRPTSPLKADIAYGFNAVDTIRSNRLSIEDLLARVAALEGKV